MEQKHIFATVAVPNSHCGIQPAAVCHWARQDGLTETSAPRINISLLTVALFNAGQ